jgi:uncharacterized phage protein (TIGR01671 family)
MENRIIKFRAWDKTYKRMNYKVQVGNTDYADQNYTCNSIWVDYSDNKSEGWMNADEKCIDLMQYTGLKDKNGKDDYIGDLIRVFVPRDKGVGYELKGIAEIIYNDAYSKTEFIYRTGDFVGNTFDGYELIECYEHENIGNIFQHP